MSTQSTASLLNVINWGNFLQDQNSTTAVPFLIKNVIFLKKKTNLIFCTFSDIMGLNVPANKLPVVVKYVIKSEIYSLNFIIQISSELLTFIPSIQKHFQGAC